MSQNPYQPPQAPLESLQSAQARDLGLVGKYLVGAIVVGAMEVIDASLLAATQGVPDNFSYVVSAIEVLWFIVSVFALIRVKHSRSRLLAIAFLSYTVLGIVVAAFLGASEALPMWVVIFGGAFGLAYAGASAFVGFSVWGRERAA
jgi:hypothetical protein